MKVNLQYQSVYELYNLPIILLSNSEVEVEVFPGSGEKELWDKFYSNPVIFKITISGCKLRRHVPKFISESKIYLDELTKDFGSLRYFIEKGYILSESDTNKLNSYLKEIKENTENNQDSYPFDSLEQTDPVLKSIKQLVDAGKITEYEKQIYDKNIKIVSIDNNEEDDLGLKKNTKTHSSLSPYIILVLLSNQFKKYGYSFTSRKILEEQEQNKIFDCAIEFNDQIELSIEYSEIQQDKFLLIIYELPLNWDAISEIIPPKKNYNYIMYLDLDEYPIEAGSEESIKLDPYMTHLDNSKFKTIRIYVRKENLKDWINTTFKIKSLYYNSQLRQLAINSKNNI